MSTILEIVMLLSFGVSWPISIRKSYKARTTKGKSVIFLCLVIFGYASGIASKFTNEAYMASFATKWYVLIFYFLNMSMCGIDLSIYIRNYKIDKLNGLNKSHI